VGRVAYVRAPGAASGHGDGAGGQRHHGLLLRHQHITDMNNKGDGMAFFLGDYPSALLPNSYRGCGIGTLFSSSGGATRERSYCWCMN
jgi:hypothetical protein